MIWPALVVAATAVILFICVMVDIVRNLDQV